MSRYAEVGNNHIVVRSKFKHTTPIIEGPTLGQEKKHKSKMQNDLIKKYELIDELTDLGLLDIRWSDNYVEFKKTISGVNYDLYLEYLKEKKKKESENNESSSL